MSFELLKSCKQAAAACRHLYVAYTAQRALLHPRNWRLLTLCCFSRLHHICLFTVKGFLLLPWVSNTANVPFCRQLCSEASVKSVCGGCSSCVVVSSSLSWPPHCRVTSYLHINTHMWQKQAPPLCTQSDDNCLYCNKQLTTAGTHSLLNLPFAQCQPVPACQSYIEGHNSRSPSASLSVIQLKGHDLYPRIHMRRPHPLVTAAAQLPTP